MTEPVVPDWKGSVLVLTLNAPKSRNAISPEMRADLLQHLRDADEDSAVRAIVLTGQDGNFCSGGQLGGGNGGALPKPDAERTRRNIGMLQDIVEQLCAGSKPTVAAVEGYAYGAGMSLAAACDIVVASRTARFCASFGRVGLMADAGLSWTLPRRVGHNRARTILLSGRVIDGTEALDIGLANELVAEGDARSEALAAAMAFERIAPLSIAAQKRLLAENYASLKEVLMHEAAAQARLVETQDYTEGRLAFRDRRAPVFRGI